MANQADAQEQRMRHAALVECFNCVLYPFDLTFLFDRLPDAGWIVGERIDEAQDEGGRIKAPVKGNVRLRVDQGRQILGVAGRDPVEVVDAFREIRDLARETSTFAPNVQTYYVEFRYMGEVKGTKPPPEALQRWWRANPEALRLGTVLDDFLPSDGPIGPYGLRFASSGVDANRQNWAELTVAPVNNTGQTDYHFDLIFRNAESEIVERVASQAKEIINRVLATIET